MGASLNRCKRMKDQAGDFLKQLVVKLEHVLIALLQTRLTTKLI